MTVVAVVPARGGSKGLPGKNLHPLDGHPLLAWSVAAGLAASSVDRVICSTDDEAIAAAARAAGAEVPFLRPPELAADLTPDLPVFQHLLAWLRSEGIEPELLVHLRPTTPLRGADDIDRAVELLRADPAATACRSVCPPPHTPYKMFGPLRGDYLEPLLEVPGVPEPHNAPRQELPDVLWHPGVIDVVRPATLDAGSMTGPRILPLPIDPRLAVDIDHAEDLELAAVRSRRLDVVRPEPAPLPWEDVRLVIVDVDGTLTAGTAYYSESGEELKRFHTHDAHGLSMLRKAGIHVAVVTAEATGFPKAWATKVGVEHLRSGVADKESEVRELAELFGVPLSSVCAIGDDWSDVPAFRLVDEAGGIACAVGGARPEVVALSHHHCTAPGGAGAVREVCDLILAATNTTSP